MSTRRIGAAICLISILISLLILKLGVWVGEQITLP